MKEYRFSKIILEKPVDVLICDTGSGISAVISGGDRGHIGSVSAIYPDLPLISHQFPAHREGIVTDRWANALYERFGCAVVVSAGVHYDGINKEQILRILDDLEDLLNEVLNALSD